MRTALLTVLLLRMRVLRLRWGITMTGMTLASGRGVWAGVVLVGVWALLFGQATVPAFLVASASCGAGLVCGAVYGLVPRRPRFGIVRRPTLRRVCVCGVAGAVSMPLIDVYGRLPQDEDGVSGTASAVLLAAYAAVGLYLHAQYRRGVHREQGFPPPEQPAARLIRAARLRLGEMSYARPPSWGRSVAAADDGGFSPRVFAERPDGRSVGGAAETERLRRELADSESDLRWALHETAARLAACRGKAAGVDAQIAANRTLARIIRQAEESKIGLSE